MGMGQYPWCPCEIYESGGRDPSLQAICCENQEIAGSRVQISQVSTGCIFIYPTDELHDFSEGLVETTNQFYNHQGQNRGFSTWSLAQRGIPFPFWTNWNWWRSKVRSPEPGMEDDATSGTPAVPLSRQCPDRPERTSRKPRLFDGYKMSITVEELIVVNSG